MAATKSAPHRGIVLFCSGAAAWALATLISAAQGQLFAAYHGRPQEWWATLGYTAAVFSVWGLLTPAVLATAGKVHGAQLSSATRSALAVLGYPAITVLHVFLFTALFWPVYGSAGSTPFTMVKPVLLANLDKSAFAYVALIAVARLSRPGQGRSQAPDPAGTAPPDGAGLWIRVAGGSRLVRYPEIDWIAAAGDYAEVHAGKRSLLTDRSLATLAERLAKNEFVRIHRRTIVRLDRVREVRSLGRGDASILLQNGQALHLSRRYRDNLVAHLPL